MGATVTEAKVLKPPQSLQNNAFQLKKQLKPSKNRTVPEAKILKCPQNTLKPVLFSFKTSQNPATTRIGLQIQPKSSENRTVPEAKLFKCPPNPSKQCFSAYKTAKTQRHPHGSLVGSIQNEGGHPDSRGSSFTLKRSNER